VFELVEVMGKSGIRDVQLLLKFPDDKSLWMRGQQELHDAEPDFGAHGGEHVSELDDLFLGVPRSVSHTSIFAAIWNIIKSITPG
jgi:hypothetical protein